VGNGSLDIRPARGGEYRIVVALVKEYLASLPFEARTFQDVERELRNIDTEYGPPDGVALLAHLEGQAVGVVGVRRFDADVAELKRMWVRAQHRGSGLGRRLADAALREARILGYRAIRLDTVVGVMDTANHLYESLGFVDIPPYRDNPIDGARFMELRLKRLSGEASAGEPWS
jgi:GNAT superfamily N-acetyltransferase